MSWQRVCDGKITLGKYNQRVGYQLNITYNTLIPQKLLEVNGFKLIRLFVFKGKMSTDICRFPLGVTWPNTALSTQSIASESYITLYI